MEIADGRKANLVTLGSLKEGEVLVAPNTGVYIKTDRNDGDGYTYLCNLANGESVLMNDETTVEYKPSATLMLEMSWTGKQS